MRSFNEFMESKIFNENDLDHYAQVSDEALDNAYHYGRSKPGTFGYEANKGSAKFALNLMKNGETDIEKISDAIHKGWASVATTYDDPIYATKPEKKENRMKLANTSYSELSEDEKEKDRVVARSLLQAYQQNNT
jgi:hypothetical protein